MVAYSLKKKKCPVSASLLQQKVGNRCRQHSVCFQRFLPLRVVLLCKLFVQAVGHAGERMALGIRIMCLPLISYLIALDRCLTSLRIRFLICKNGDNNICACKSKSSLKGIHTIEIHRLVITRQYSCHCGIPYWPLSPVHPPASSSTR